MSSKNCGLGDYIFNNSYQDVDVEGYRSKICQLWVKTNTPSQDKNLPEKQCTQVSSTKKRKSNIPGAEDLFKRPKNPPVRNNVKKSRKSVAKKPTHSNVLLETVISVADKIVKCASLHPSVHSLDLHVKSTKKTTAHIQVDKQKLDGNLSPTRNFLRKSLPNTSNQNNKAIEHKLDQQVSVNKAQAKASLRFPKKSTTIKDNLPRRVEKDDNFFGNFTIETPNNFSDISHEFSNLNQPKNAPVLNISKHLGNHKQTDASLLNKTFSLSPEPLRNVPNKNESNALLQNKRSNLERPRVNASSINPSIVQSTVQPIHGSLIPAVPHEGDGRIVANNFNNCQYIKIVYVK